MYAEMDPRLHLEFHTLGTPYSQQVRLVPPANSHDVLKTHRGIDPPPLGLFLTNAVLGSKLSGRAWELASSTAQQGLALPWVGPASKHLSMVLNSWDLIPEKERECFTGLFGFHSLRS